MVVMNSTPKIPLVLPQDLGHVTCLIPRRRQNPKHRSFVFYSCIYIIEKCDNEKPSIANCMCLWLQTDQTQLLFHFPLDQPCSQGSLSCFEKDQTLVMWKWVLINYAARAGPPLHFVDWTMKYCLGQGENSFLKTVLEFLSWLQSVLLSASFYSIILKENRLLV